MFTSCLQKVDTVKALFSGCQSDSERYHKIIELGKNCPRLNEQYKVPENLVRGCQSRMFLHSAFQGDKVVFEAESDALISSGLATLLIMVYSNETPETILKFPPDYLEEIGITSALTPNRANGLYSMHLKMKQDALKLFMKKNEEV